MTPNPSLNRTPAGGLAPARRSPVSLLRWASSVFVSTFIFGFTLMHPVANAQPITLYRIGVVSAGGPYTSAVEGLRDGLKEAGLIEGKQYVLHVRDVKGDLKSAEQAARSLEQERVDVIFSTPTSVTLAAKRATSRAPIVFVAGSDPVSEGLVNSFAKPGGRVTGVYSFRSELTGKRLEILKEIAPRIRKVAMFYNPDNPILRDSLSSTREAAHRLGIVLIEREARSGDDLQASLRTLKSVDADALFIPNDATVQSQASMVIEAARTRRLPAVFNDRSLVTAGGLASYGVSYYAMGRSAAKYVRQILLGASPADLPVEGSERFELVLNSRTASEIGLTFPPSLLLRADEVIQ